MYFGLYRGECVLVMGVTRPLPLATIKLQVAILPIES